MFLQKWGWFFFLVVATRLSCETLCIISAKQHNCRVLVLERNVQNVAAGSALLAVVETSRFIGLNVNTLFISTCWTMHIFNSPSYFVVHRCFFLYFVDWNELLGNNCLWVPSSSFFSKEKACFFCFCRLYVRCNKRELCEPTTRLHTFHNHKLISEMLHNTVKRLAFLSLGTILARTMHISNTILNWFWVLFKNVNPLAKW